MSGGGGVKKYVETWWEEQGWLAGKVHNKKLIKLKHVDTIIHLDLDMFVGTRYHITVL